MMTVTTWTRAWCRTRSCMMTMRVALVMGRIREACHDRSLVIKDVTERSILVVKGCDIQGLLEDYEDLPGE